jgi:hypothetical protein
MVSTDIGVWVAVIYTLAVLSFLYKENVFSRFAEKTVVGAAAGWFLLIAIQNLRSFWDKAMGGTYLSMIPLILGLFLFAALSTKGAFLARWPVAVFIGVGVGTALRTLLDAQFLTHIVATINLPLTDIVTSFNTVLVVIFVLCSLSYFIMTREHTGGLGIITKIGRLVILGAFGTTIAGEVMAKFSLILGRLYFLLVDWLGLA